MCFLLSEPHLFCFEGNYKLPQLTRALGENPVGGSVCLTPQLFLQVIVKNMGWNLVGPVVRCLLWNDKEDDKRKYYFLMLDLLVEVS